MSNDPNTVEYWKKIAAYLAECHAATLESTGSRRSCSKHDRNRFQDICRISSDALQGEFNQHCTNHLDVDTLVKHAIDRCDRAVKGEQKMGWQTTLTILNDGVHRLQDATRAYS